MYDCFAGGVSRVRASCTVPRLQVRPLVSHNEDLNSLNSLNSREKARGVYIWIQTNAIGYPAGQRCTVYGVKAHVKRNIEYTHAHQTTH